MWIFQPFKYYYNKNYGNKGIDKHWIIIKKCYSSEVKLSLQYTDLVPGLERE